ncbi:SCO family protein [Paracoccus fistulariae]|uniref:SCO family protein n=1 Tax=Paracoccus fistulariae TaxID=658446 RepID=A0ABY7SJM9_9RHOB|nr:SCO family protein [Paracoccus fistulariae]MDB6180936.1 SCO family protein [Paracoccus fistulariae]WCR06232.1 SCO family protein [Paracoccus fistulariae]
MSDKKILIMGSVVAALVLIAGGVYMTQANSGDPDFASCQKGNVAGGMESFGTDFTLTRDDGQRVTAAEVFTKPSLLYFGYTSCPDVCPMDSARNAEAETLLKEQGKDVQTIMITVDPRRDTPEVMKDFTDLFSEDMIGLTGSDEEIAAVNKGWRNYYRANDDEDKEYYLVDHMTNTYLVLPGNKTVEFFGRDVEPELMAERVGCFIDAMN